MFSLDIGLKGHEVLVPNGSQYTIDLLWGLWWERHRGHHGGPRIHGPGPFQAIATATEGCDVYYLTVSFPRFAFADGPGGRGRPRTSCQCDRGYAPQFVKKTHEHSGAVGSPKR